MLMMEWTVPQKVLVLLYETLILYGSKEEKELKQPVHCNILFHTAT